MGFRRHRLFDLLQWLKLSRQLQNSIAGQIQGRRLQQIKKQVAIRQEFLEDITERIKEFEENLATVAEEPTDITEVMDLEMLSARLVRLEETLAVILAYLEESDPNDVIDVEPVKRNPSGLRPRAKRY